MLGWLDFLKIFGLTTLRASRQRGQPDRNRRVQVRRNPLPGSRILVVDDSSTVLILLKRMLHQAGLRTLTAATGEEALELLADVKPDAIILDIVLPGMDGFAVLRRIRMNPATRDIPVVVMSGNAQAIQQFYLQRIGADDLLQKPFTRADVFEHLGRLLDTRGVPVRRREAQRGAPPGY